MSDPALGLLMLTLIVIVIMMGFPTAFTLMGLGMFFGFIAFYVPGQSWAANRDHAHQHHHRADQAARDAPEGADDQRRHRERGGHAPERELDRIEHLVHQRAPFHHISHQHE